MQFYNSSIPSFKNGAKKLNKTFVYICIHSKKAKIFAKIN